MQKLHIREEEICEPTTGHTGIKSRRLGLYVWSILGKERTETRVLNKVVLEGFNLILYILAYWGDLGVDVWIILGWISRRWDVGIWTGLGWPRIETGGGRL